MLTIFKITFLVIIFLITLTQTPASYQRRYLQVHNIKLYKKLLLFRLFSMLMSFVCPLNWIF